MKVFNLLKHPRAKYSTLMQYFISESECKQHNQILVVSRLYWCKCSL